MPDICGFIGRLKALLIGIVKRVKFKPTFAAAFSIIDHFISVIGSLLPLIKIFCKAVGRAAVHDVFVLPGTDVFQPSAVVQNVIRGPYRITGAFLLVFSCTWIKDEDIQTALPPVKCRYAVIELIRCFNPQRDEHLIRPGEAAGVDIR